MEEKKIRVIKKVGGKQKEQKIFRLLKCLKQFLFSFFLFFGELAKEGRLLKFHSVQNCGSLETFLEAIFKGYYKSLNGKFK